MRNEYFADGLVTARTPPQLCHVIGQIRAQDILVAKGIELPAVAALAATSLRNLMLFAGWIGARAKFSSALTPAARTDTYAQKPILDSLSQ